MEFAQLTPGRAFKPFHSLLYYAQRLVTPPRLRAALADGMSRYIDARHGTMASGAHALHRHAIEPLRRDGYAPLGRLLGDAQLAQIHAWLRDKPLHARGKVLPPFSADRPPPGARMAEYGLADVIACPHLLEFANHPGLLRLAADYIGCKPTISAIGLRWSFPDSGTGTGLQAFHRDADDWRFIKVFAYLTDVDEDCGPHVYVKGTHLEPCGVKLKDYSDAEIMDGYGAERIVSVTGSAGMAFTVNTHGIHKGMLPKRKPRLLLQVQYSLLPVYLYRYRPVESERAGEVDGYINRLFVMGKAG